MPLYKSLYVSSEISCLRSNYGNFPNIVDITLGLETINFPAGTNPTALGSATPQDFADSVAALINDIFTQKFGAGNFTPIEITHSFNGTVDNFQLSNLELFDVWVKSSAQLVNELDIIAWNLDAGTGVGENIFAEYDLTTPATNAAGEKYIDMIINVPKDYNADIQKRGSTT